MAPVAGAETIRFVDASAAPGGDGLSWDAAFVYLFQALDDAAADQTVEQI